MVTKLFAIVLGLVVGYLLGVRHPATESVATWRRVTDHPVTRSIAGGVAALIFVSVFVPSGPIEWPEDVVQVEGLHDFDAVVDKSHETPVLVEFYADWCGPCHLMAPNLKAIASEGVPVAVINMDKTPGLAMRYEVGALPTTLVLYQGKVVGRTMGYHTTGTLRAMAESPRA